MRQCHNIGTGRGEGIIEERERENERIVCDRALQKVSDKHG